MNTSPLGVLAFITGCLIGPLAIHSWAQDYPSKPIRFIVTTSPGSGTDLSGRIIAGGLADVLRQQVYVENRAGAGGNIGAALAAKAPADGHTLLQINNNHTINVTLYNNLTYDLIRDFYPIGMFFQVPYMIVVHPSLPVKSVSDLIKLAKSRPGAIMYASAGVGSGTFMAAELFKSETGVDMLHIPYVGGGPSLTAVISGEVHMYGAPLSSALPYIPQRLRALAVTSAKRHPLLPGVPTIAESIPRFEFVSWAGLMLPVKTPKEVIAKVRSAMVLALSSAEVTKRFADLGSNYAGDQPGEFAAFLKEDIEKMGKIVRKNRMTAD